MLNNSYIRELSPLEKIYLSRRSGNQHFVNHGIIEGTGILDEEEWCQAVAVASQEHPGTRIVLKQKGLKQYWVTGGKPPAVSFKKSSWDGQSSEGIDFITSNLCPYKGPVCEIILLECPDKHRVVINTLHAAMDGIGTFLWGADIFRDLQGKTPVGSYSQRTDIEIAKLFKNKTQPDLTKKGISPFDGNKIDSKDGIWIRKTIPKITPRIITKICKAISEETQKKHAGPVRMLIPVNLRRKADNLSSTANLVGNIYIDIEPDDDHKTLYLKLLKKIKNNEECYFPFLLKLIKYLPSKMISSILREQDMKNIKKGLYSQTGVVTHLSNIKPEQIQGGGFIGTSWVSINTMSGTGQPPLFVTISEWRTTNGKHTNIIFKAPERQATMKQLDDFATSVISAIA
jgi:hypothetical protein